MLKMKTVLRSSVRLLLLVVVAVAAVQFTTAPVQAAETSAVETARHLLQQHEYKAAIKKLNGILEDQPDSGRARFLKALALAHSGQSSKALSVFEELVKDYPDMAEAWNNLGVLRARTGHLEGARKALEKAVSLNPEHIAARQNLGDVYVALARRSYMKAQHLSPGNRIVKAKTQVLSNLMRSNSIAEVQALAGRTASSGAAQNGSVRVASIGVPDIATAAATAKVAHSKEARKSAVVDALHAWANAWSSQDLTAYFAAYAPSFDPNKGRTIREWRALRVRRVSQPKWISVELNDIDVKLTGPDTATVHFAQVYHSNSYHDQVQKTVTLKHTSRGWLITTES